MRGKQATPRVILPDAKYNNVQVAKFTNYLMHSGKKTVAQSVMYAALSLVAKKIDGDPVEAFETAVKNAMPSLEVKSKRVGGSNYQVPIPVRGERRFALACLWILQASRGKKGRPMAQKLADELVLASKNEGDAVKKKMDVQRMAEANRAFAHFARR
ncbi:MAG TPA: 30S ribosomal protein S7 [Patescibacteria group bacterium]|nr:30S ribosomal protein S7 [Patescibacteria group bacterium]